MIFGYVTHEKKSATDKECTVMNELHVDILDYIECATVGELAFHTMWSEFDDNRRIVLLQASRPFFKSSWASKFMKNPCMLEPKVLMLFIV